MPLRHRVALVVDHGLDVFAVRAGIELFVVAANPGIDIEVHAADGGVRRRIVGVVQVGLARKIALELYPVELLNLLLLVGVNEGV